MIKRNAAFLPAYSFLLGLIALFGYMAIAAGADPSIRANSAVPQLIQFAFPTWFAGFALASIAIGALVPASVMSIAASNLFTRNIWTEYIHRGASPTEEATVSKWISLLVKLGAVVFILIPGLTTYAIDLQLAGGVIILQTLPAVFLALYVRWLDRWAVAAGWVVGMASGVFWLIASGFTGSLYTYFGQKLYIGLAAFALNLAVVVVWSLVTYGLRRGEEPSYLPDDVYRTEATYEEGPTSAT